MQKIAKASVTSFFALHIFPSSHHHIFTSSHIHIFTSSHPHIFECSHLHLITSSHLQLLTSSSLHILTSSSLHILTSSQSHLFYLHLIHSHLPSLRHLNIFLSLCFMLYDLHSYISHYTSLRSRAIRRLVLIPLEFKECGNSNTNNKTKEFAGFYLQNVHYGTGGQRSSEKQGMTKKKGITRTKKKGITHIYTAWWFEPL